MATCRYKLLLNYYGTQTQVGTPDTGGVLNLKFYIRDQYVTTPSMVQKTEGEWCLVLDTTIPVYVHKPANGDDIDCIYALGYHPITYTSTRFVPEYEYEKLPEAQQGDGYREFVRGGDPGAVVDHHPILYCSTDTYGTHVGLVDNEYLFVMKSDSTGYSIPSTELHGAYNGAVTRIENRWVTRDGVRQQECTIVNESYDVHGLPMYFGKLSLSSSPHPSLVLGPDIHPCILDIEIKVRKNPSRDSEYALWTKYRSEGGTQRLSEYLEAHDSDLYETFTFRSVQYSFGSDFDDCQYYNGDLTIYECDPYEITPHFDDITKEYDCTEIDFSTQSGYGSPVTFYAGDGKAVTIGVTYSPAIVGKDVCDVEVTAALDPLNALTYYYFNPPNPKFRAKITPKELRVTCPSCISDEDDEEPSGEESECLWAKKIYDCTPLEGSFGYVEPALCNDVVYVDVSLSGAVVFKRNGNNEIIGYETNDIKAKDYAVGLSYTLSGADAGNYKLPDDAGCSGVLRIKRKKLNDLVCPDCLYEEEDDHGNSACIWAEKTYDGEPLDYSWRGNISLPFLDQLCNDNVIGTSHISGSIRNIQFPDRWTGVRTYKNGEECKDVGDYPVTYTYVLSGSDLANYILPDIMSCSGILRIKPKEIPGITCPSCLPDDDEEDEDQTEVEGEEGESECIWEKKVYDASSIVFSFPAPPDFGICDGDDVTVSYSLTGDVSVVDDEDLHVEIETSKNAKDYSVTLTYVFSGSDLKNYTLPENLSCSGILRITPKPLTLTCKPCSEVLVSGATEICVYARKVYDSRILCSGGLGSVTGFIEGDDVSADVTISGGSPMYLNGEIAGVCSPSKDVGTYTITITYSLSGSDAGNYELPDDPSCSGVLKITPYHINLPCIFGDNLWHTKVYDGGGFDVEEEYVIELFPAINESTEEITYGDTITLGITYSPDITQVKDVGLYSPVTATYTGMGNYTNFTFTEPEDCWASFEITCAPLTPPTLTFPPKETYFDDCGNLIGGLLENNDISTTFGDGGVFTLAGVGDETVEATISAKVCHYPSLVVSGAYTLVWYWSYGILYSFDHNDSNYCDIPDGVHTYGGVESELEIKPFGPGELDSKFTGAKTISESYIANGEVRHRDVYYPETFTIIVRCRGYGYPDDFSWDGVSVHPEPIQTQPTNNCDYDSYYSITIKTEPNEVEEEGETYIKAHKLVCLDTKWNITPGHQYVVGNTYMDIPETMTIWNMTKTKYYAPVLANGGTLYSWVYDGRFHNPVTNPSSVILEDVSLPVSISIPRNDPYWCYDDGWVTTYQIKHADSYDILFMENAQGENGEYVGLYEENTATITPKQLSVGSITKPWDWTKSSVVIEEEDGEEVEIHIKKEVNATGWEWVDESYLNVVADYEFPSSDVAYYCCSLGSCPLSSGWYKKENGNWELITERGWSVAGSKYIVPECVDIGNAEIVYREGFDNEHADTYDHGYPTDYTLENATTIRGEITLSSSLFQIALYQGGELEYVWGEERDYSIVYDAETHTITLEPNDILKQMPGFGDFAVNDDMVSWILKRAKNDNEEEKIINENGVNCLNADTYTVLGYLDLAVRSDEDDVVGTGIGRVTLTITPRPLYLTNLTVEYVD